MRIKKNIIFLVLTLLIFIPYASAECDFSIPGRIVCHEERTQPYNTSKPTIIAKFYEFPVEREEFRLTSWETNAIKPLDIILEEPTYLSYVSTNHLPDGKFEFYLRARDIDSNIVEMHVNFTVNASQMWVYVLKPENKHIIKPKFAVGDNTTFPLELKLQRPGKCRYNIYPIQGDINQQTYNILPMEFQQSASDPTINYDNAFNMSGVITGYQYNGDLATLYMICKEDGDSRFNYVEIEVGADLYPPVISAQAVPSPVVNVYSKRSNLTITTDDLSVCTINNIAYPSCTGCSPITATRGPGFDFTLRSQFNKTYEEELIIPASNPSYNYTFNLTCDNMANRQSSLLFTLPVEYIQVQGVTFLSPPSIVNTTNIHINISVVFEQDICQYTFDVNDSNSWKQLMFTNNYINGEAILSVAATAKEGLQTIYIRCQSLVGISQRSLRVDTIKPLVPNVSMDANTCSLNLLRAEITGADASNGSGINRFHYNITLDDNSMNYTNTIYGVTQHIVSASINKNYENLTYTLRAWAEDNAGNIGPTSAPKKIKVTGPGIDACDYTAPNIILNFTQNNSTKEWTVQVNCSDGGSGCKGTFGYSIHTNTSQECSFASTKNLMDPIIISNSSKFCAIVFDNNNNNKSTSRIFDVIYPATCYDGQKNGDETGVDCGGSCPSCPVNSSCIKNSDCESNYCLAGMCTVATCTDEIKNGLETGIDCGGPTCGPCGVNAGCTADSDCVSGNCENNKCVEATCFDEKHDGLETDIDCGGPDCNACPMGWSCITHLDCETEYCDSSGRCAIDPTKDTDGDGLPDIWEIEHCGCATCCDPNEDMDGDGYTNLEEYEWGTDPNDPNDYPPFHKLNPLSLVFLILGGLLLFGGIGLLVYEMQKRKKTEEENERKKMMDSMSTIPKIASVIKNEIPKREFSPDEIRKRQELKRKALLMKGKKRRRIFDEFDLFGNKPKVEEQKTIVKKPVEQPPKKEVIVEKQEKKPESKSSPEKADKKTGDDKISEKQEDPFSKLSDINNQNAKKDSDVDPFEKLKNLAKDKNDKK